jgi:Leucine-rich repeat (LRR) protein
LQLISFPHSIRENEIFPCKCDRGSDIGLYLTCEGGNLASLGVAFTTVASLNSSKVEEILIRKSHFLRLFGTVFHQSTARVVKIIDTPFMTIDAFTFWGINSTLEELRIINSSLTEFPRDAFKVLGNLKILEINHHRIKELNSNEFEDSQLPSRLERLHLTNGNISELAVNVFQNLKKVKFIDLHGNHLVNLKKNQFRGLRDAESLDLSFNDIVKLDSPHIADLTKLTFFNGSHNKLNELSR